MNVPLVESLVQVILSLSKEERSLLEEKLNRKKNWRETLKQIDELQAQIREDRGGKPFNPPIAEIIHQMREERTQYFKVLDFICHCEGGLRSDKLWAIEERPPEAIPSRA